MKAWAIAWTMLVAIAMTMFGLWIIVNGVPAHWSIAMLMFFSSADLFVIGVMLTNDRI